MPLSPKLLLATTLAFGSLASAETANCPGRPEEAAVKFAQALDNTDYESAYQMLSIRTRESISFEDFRQHYVSRNEQLGGPPLPNQFYKRGQTSYGKAFQRIFEGTRPDGIHQWTVSFVAQYPNQPVQENISVVCERGSFAILNFNG